MLTIYHIAPRRSGHVWVGKVIETWFDKEELNYVELENIAPKSFRKRYPGKDGIVILQIRDFLNWYASYVRSGGRTDYSGRNFKNRKPLMAWEAIAREYYRPGAGYLGTKRKVVKVMYDEFFANPRYRRWVCGQLGGVYDTTNLLRVFDNGGGSSFDGQAFDGQADRMKVLERFKQVDPQIYRNIFRQRPGIYKLYMKHLVNREKISFIKALMK